MSCPVYKLSIGVSETLRIWQLKLGFVEQVWQCQLPQYRKKNFLLGAQIMNALSPVHSLSNSNIALFRPFTGIWRYLLSKEDIKRSAAMRSLPRFSKISSLFRYQRKSNQPGFYLILLCRFQIVL